MKILFEKPDYKFPYQLAEPVQTWKLPNALVEISGLSFIDPHKEACACSIAETAPKAGVTKIDISAIGRGRPAPVMAR